MIGSRVQFSGLPGTGGGGSYVPSSYFLKKTTAERLALTPASGDIVFDTSLRMTFQYVVDRWWPCFLVDPRSGVYWSDDFQNGNATVAMPDWNQTAAGAGAVLSLRAALSTDYGKVTIETGSTATGRISLYKPLSSILIGASTISTEWRVKLSALSTVGEEYTVYMGLGDQSGAGDMVDGVYFKYDRLTDGDFWSVCSSNNSARTKTVSANVPTSADFVRYRIDIAGTTATYYVNDVLIGTVTTNMPTGANRNCSSFFKIEKSAGTTTRFLDLDYAAYYQAFDTRR